MTSRGSQVQSLSRPPSVSQHPTFVPALGAGPRPGWQEVHDVLLVVLPAVSDESLSIGSAAAAYSDAYGIYPAPPANFAKADTLAVRVTRHVVKWPVGAGGETAQKQVFT